MICSLLKVWFPYSHRRSATGQITGNQTNHRQPHKSLAAAAQSRHEVYLSQAEAASLCYLQCSQSFGFHITAAYCGFIGGVCGFIGGVCGVIWKPGLITWTYSINIIIIIVIIIHLVLFIHYHQFFILIFITICNFILLFCRCWCQLCVTLHRHYYAI